MTRTDPGAVARSYIQTWNATDAAARSARLADDWAADAVYVDPLAKAEGRDGIDALIGGVQQRFEGFRFAVIGEPSGHGDFVRFSWSLGPDGVAPPIQGSDVVELRDGRIARVIGFLDQLPG